MIQSRLGKGQFGSVYLCYNMHDEQIVTMKVIKRRKRRKTLRSIQNSASAADLTPSLTYEMEILKQMVHANMTPLYEIIDDPNSDKVFMIT